MDGLLRRALSSSGVCCFRDSFQAIGRWLSKVPSNMMPKEKTPKLQLNRKTAPEKFIYLQLRAVVLIWTHHLQLHCEYFWGKDLPSFSKVFPTRIWTGFSDFVVVLWDIWRPLLFCHFLQSRIGLGFFLRIQQILGLAGSMPQGTVGGFGGVGWGGTPLNLRHVKVLRGKKIHGKCLKVSVFIECVDVFVGWISPPQKKNPIIQPAVTPWWPTPTTQRHSGRHR